VNTSRTRYARRWLAALLLTLAGIAAPPMVAQQAGGEDGYVCPPCGCGEDDKVADKAGTCTACRMKLIKKSEIQRVAILLFPGVQIIDYTAPWEVFGQAGFEVFTVAKEVKPITTAMGMSVTPRYSFADSPVPTILMVPGGGGVRGVTADAVSIEWVGKTAGKATHVLSVCNGAFILAKAGLLDNQRATTFYHQLDQLRSAAPGIQVVTDQRWVDIGKVITSTGLSSGLDSSLYLVSKIRGLAAAQRTALQLEYDWKPDAGYARGALAEQHMPQLSGEDWDAVEMLSTSGDRDRWEARYRIKSDVAPAVLLERVKATLENMREWKASAPTAQARRSEGTWSFVDDVSIPWSGSARVEPAAGETGVWLITVSVAREGTRITSG